MADHQFEKKLSQQLADFKLKPGTEVWQQLELQLEKDRKRRRWFFYLPIAGLLMGGLLYAVWPVKETAKVATVVRPTLSKASTTTGETNANVTPFAKTRLSTNLIDSTVYENELAVKKLPAQSNSTSLIEQKAIRKKQVVNTVTIPNRQSEAVTTQKQKNRSEVTPVTGKVSVQKEEAADPTIVSVITNQTQQKMDSSTLNQSDEVKNDTVQTMAVTTVVDTSSIAAAMPTPVITKKKWQFGLHINAGLSDIRESLFPGSGYKSFADAAPLGLNNGTPGGVTRIVQYDYAIKPSFQFGAGVLLRKPFTSKHALITGLYYQYASYAVTQRQRIDTLLPLSSQFSTISIKEMKAKFSIHALNLPLELELKIADIKKGSLKFNAGLHQWFVLSSRQTDTLSVFRYVTTADRSSQSQGMNSGRKETKANIYQPQLYLAPSFEWKNGNEISSQLGVYLGYGLRPAYNAATKDYWWQTGVRYRLFFNR